MRNRPARGSQPLLLLWVWTSQPQGHSSAPSALPSRRRRRLRSVHRHWNQDCGRKVRACGICQPSTMPHSSSSAAKPCPMASAMSRSMSSTPGIMSTMARTFSATSRARASSLPGMMSHSRVSSARLRLPISQARCSQRSSMSAKSACCSTILPCSASARMRRSLPGVRPLVRLGSCSRYSRGAVSPLSVCTAPRRASGEGRGLRGGRLALYRMASYPSIF